MVSTRPRAQESVCDRATGAKSLLITRLNPLAATSFSGMPAGADASSNGAGASGSGDRRPCSGMSRRPDGAIPRHRRTWLAQCHGATSLAQGSASCRNQHGPRRLRREPHSDVGNSLCRSGESGSSPLPSVAARPSSGHWLQVRIHDTPSGKCIGALFGPCFNGDGNRRPS